MQNKMRPVVLSSAKPLGYGLNLRTKSVRNRRESISRNGLNGGNGRCEANGVNSSNVIPVKCFDPMIDAKFPEVVPSKSNQNGNGIVEEHHNGNNEENGEMKDESFVLGDDDRYSHHHGLRDKENMLPVQKLLPFHGQPSRWERERPRRLPRRDSDVNLTLEQKLKKIITRWESHEKIKKRQKDRAGRCRPFR